MLHVGMQAGRAGIVIAVWFLVGDFLHPVHAVEAARQRQQQRAGKPNARLGQAGTMAACRLSGNDQQLLERAIEALQLSARAMHRILRVARTIADLAGSEHIATAHLTEALGYRGLDRGLAAHAA
jgi:magnesium chelatase family protein